MALKTPGDVMKLIADEGVEVIDIRFMDFPGLWQHFSIPSRELSEDDFEAGLGFDGSSIRGWQTINESDMLVKPVPETGFIDPFLARKTLVMIGNISDPITGQDYTRDPRNIARKAEAYLRSSGIADTAYIGPEAEFFIFDDVRFDQNEHEGYYHIDSEEGRWNSGREENPNLGYKPRYKEGYFPVPPTDSQQDLRSEMMMTLESIGVLIEAQHHEVATAGQGEIDMRFAPLVTMADNMLKYKYVVKNTARRYNKTATFMPKPLFLDNGSGMHTHMSFWKDGSKPVLRRRLRRAVRDGAARHRRHSRARGSDHRLHQPHHQQLQAAGAGLRGAGEPGLLAAQPQRGDPAADVLHLTEGEADRVPVPRCLVQPLSRLFRHDDGCDGRHRQQDSSRRTA